MGRRSRSRSPSLEPLKKSKQGRESPKRTKKGSSSRSRTARKSRSPSSTSSMKGRAKRLCARAEEAWDRWKELDMRATNAIAEVNPRLQRRGDQPIKYGPDVRDPPPQPSLSAEAEPGTVAKTAGRLGMRMSKAPAKPAKAAAPAKAPEKPAAPAKDPEKPWATAEAAPEKAALEKKTSLAVQLRFGKPASVTAQAPAKAGRPPRPTDQEAKPMLLPSKKAQFDANTPERPCCFAHQCIYLCHRSHWSDRDGGGGDFAGACCECCKDRHIFFLDRRAEGLTNEQCVDALKHASMQKHWSQQCDKEYNKMWDRGPNLGFDECVQAVLWWEQQVALPQGVEQDAGAGT